MPTTYGKRRLYHSALFVVVSGNVRRIARYDIPRVKERLLKLNLMSGDSPDNAIPKRLWTKALTTLGEYVLSRIKRDVRDWRAPIGGPPLALLTRRKKGHSRKLFESGQLLDAMTVKPLPPSEAARGVQGFRVAVDTKLREDALHRPNYPQGQPIPMHILYNIVTRTGAQIDISNEYVRRKVFGFYRSLGLLDDKEEREILSKSFGKRYIYIPPRPLFTEEYMAKLAKYVSDKMQKVYRADVKFLAKQWEGGPWMFKSPEQLIISRWNAIMSQIAAEEGNA